MHTTITIHSEKETELKKDIAQRVDAQGIRMQRYLSMPDLSRTEGSPLHELVARISALPEFQSFDNIQIPEIVPVDISFDLFDFAKDHPARSHSDTYYADDTNILRTHTTVMWYYFLQNEEVKKRISHNEAVGSISYGKVFRKDEIDRRHMNIFHQIDAWYLCPKDQKIIEQKDLENVLTSVAKAAFGEQVQYRFNKDTFPYTDPSIEMEIMINGAWVEVLGAGVVKGSVLDKLGVDSSIYNGWAFGFGLERLAIVGMELPDIRLLWSEDERVKKQLKLGQKFVEVSKFPAIPRDISFIVSKDFVPNDYFDLIREIGGNLIEEVELMDKYENAEKFGEDRISYTYHIVYRSPERTLKAEEVDALQDRLYEQTKAIYNAELR